ncbi:hypothetical protein LCGC14_1867760 [marine sediment metagenome]|uniref:Uncharacterized protein n=1 Tax=marine sediment metagenome TaxID=412755 RepID=A0A0F9IJY9_9ZZZZ
MKIKRFLPVILGLLIVLLLAGTAGAVPKGYYADSLTGGADALDAIDGAGLADRDFAITATGTVFYLHQLDADSAAAESSPDIISPNSNPGDKRWILLAVPGADAISGITSQAVGETDVQTLTNKTLTSPTVNTPTVNSPTIATPTINTSIAGTALKDEDDMASDSATVVASQQSIKAYVDSLETDTDTLVYSVVHNYITGLVLSNDTDTDHDINITAGRAVDATNAHLIILASEITKRIDAAWAVGDDAGGIDTGSVANNTLYAVWLIKRSDTGVEDALFSASFSAPTMPTDYDYKRLIGFLLTDGSANINNFTQQGDGREVVIWQKARLSVASGLSSTSYATQSLASVLPTSYILSYLPGAYSSTVDVDVYISHDGTNASTIFHANNTSTVGTVNELYDVGFASPVFVPIDGANTHYKVGAQTITLLVRAAVFQR